MAEDWRLKKVIDKLRVARYLLALADDKGRTHGEKHHLHEVIGMITVEILSDLGYEMPIITRNIDKTDISDIPF